MAQMDPAKSVLPVVHRFFKWFLHTKAFQTIEQKMVWPIKGLVQVSPTKIGWAVNRSPFYYVWLKKKRRGTAVVFVAFVTRGL